MGAVMLFVFAGALLVGGGIMMSHRSKQTRADEVRAAAQRIGWGYRDEVAFETVPDIDRFELFSVGRRRQFSNIMTSPAGDPRAVIFDYTYITGGGNSQRVHRQTVFYATSDRLTLPSFSMRPENFLHRVGSIFGYQDIDLERRPEFSRMFLLRGADEAAVRAAFTDAAAEFFERRAGTCAAGIGRELLYWRAGRRVDPGELEALVRDGLDLAERFTTTPPQV
jgi:hypothetical protein